MFCPPERLCNMEVGTSVGYRKCVLPVDVRQTRYVVVGSVSSEIPLLKLSSSASVRNHTDFN